MVNPGAPFSFDSRTPSLFRSRYVVPEIEKVWKFPIANVVTFTPLVGANAAMAGDDWTYPGCGTSTIRTPFGAGPTLVNENAPAAVDVWVASTAFVTLSTRLMTNPPSPGSVVGVVSRTPLPFRSVNFVPLSVTLWKSPNRNPDGVSVAAMVIGAGSVVVRVHPDRV